MVRWGMRSDVTVISAGVGYERWSVVSCLWKEYGPVPSRLRSLIFSLLRALVSFYDRHGLKLF